MPVTASRAPANSERIEAEELDTATDLLVAYLVDGAPAFRTRTTPTVAEAIDTIHAAGGRVDHTLANHALLLRYHRDVPLRIVDDASEVWAVSGTADTPGETAFAAQPGDLVSLLSFDGAARVTISGVLWPLNAFPLSVGTHGISNVATSEPVRLAVRGGAILVCHLRREAFRSLGR